MRVVIKVGTSTLCYKNGALNIRHFREFVQTLADIRNSGVEVVLVSSGAIGLGVGRLGLVSRPEQTEMKQACAAVGQCELMRCYSDEFAKFSQNVAQLLLTRDVIDHERRRQNVTNTLKTLLSLKTLPIINANDSVSLKHLDFDENDTLSAIVACLVEADKLIILTDVDGLYDSDPASPSANFISRVECVTSEVRSWCASKGSELSSGGMQTKLDALQIATQAGIGGVILNGKVTNNLYDYFNGVAKCTEFLPQKAARSECE